MSFGAAPEYERVLVWDRGALVALIGSMRVPTKITGTTEAVHLNLTLRVREKITQDLHASSSAGRRLKETVLKASQCSNR